MTRSRNVKKSPVKNGDTADKDVIEDEEERSCECRTYIEEEYSLACASCDMYSGTGIIAVLDSQV